MIGNRIGLCISHLGSSNLKIPNRQFTLDDILFVPSMNKHLILVSQFCMSKQTSLGFFPTFFQVKDLSTGQLYYKSENKDGVYEWPSPPLYSNILGLCPMFLPQFIHLVHIAI